IGSASRNTNTDGTITVGRRSTRNDLKSPIVTPSAEPTTYAARVLSPCGSLHAVTKQALTFGCCARIAVISAGSIRTPRIFTSSTLHPAVKPAQKFQRAISAVTTAVSGPVKLVRRIITERILHESLQLFLRSVDVPKGSVRSTDHDLSRLPYATWLTMGVQNKGLRLGQRLTEMLYAIRGLVGYNVEALGQRRLRRTVEVHDLSGLG